MPPPPPGVDTNIAETKPGAAPTSMRERLAQHRTESRLCNSCHSVIDPLGFALENFDVIGGWRTIDESGKPVDASGPTASGAKIEGLSGLRALLLEQPEQFPRTVTEKLLAYALGRRLGILRPAGGAQDRPRRGGARLPLVVAHSGNRGESHVSDVGHRTRRQN